MAHYLGLIMNSPSLTFFLLFLLALVAPAQESVRTIAVPQADTLRSSEITIIAKQESVQAEDGGYLAHPAVSTCFVAMSYQYTGGRYNDETIRFRFRMPDTVQPGKKYPLVVWLHGQGESGECNERQLAHMQSMIELLAGPQKLDFYVLVTQCPGDNRGWGHSVSHEGKGDAPITILQEILEHVLDDFPVDKNRISIVGLCSGATGAWALLRAKPNSFSAVVAFAATPPNTLFWHEHCQGTALWAFNNHHDSSAPVEPMRHFVNHVNQSGNLASLTERDGGHDTHTLAMREDNVIAWAIVQNRAKATPPPGLPIYPYNNPWKPFFLFALPLLLSIPLAIIQVIRRWRAFQKTRKT